MEGSGRDSRDEAALAAFGRLLAGQGDSVEEAVCAQGLRTPSGHGALSWHPARRESDRARLAERLIQYHSIIAAVQLALDAEQAEGGPHAYKPQTEKCLRLVYGLLQEALGVTPEEAER